VTYTHPVQVYYEDTDHSGAVYHVSYLRFLDRAREHVLGIGELVRLQRDEGVSFVVYRLEVRYRAPAVFGDRLEVRSTVRAESEYRLVFDQDVHRSATGDVLAQGEVHLACVDRAGQVTPLPAELVRRLGLEA
jgi:tol-pal system-associated acyl-CoA thioesterase